MADQAKSDDLLTPAQIAKRSKHGRSTIVIACKRLKMPLFHGRYLLNPDQVKLVLESLQKNPGRPPGEQPWLEAGVTRQYWYWKRSQEKKEADQNVRARRARKAAKTRQKNQQAKPQAQSLPARKAPRTQRHSQGK